MTEIARTVARRSTGTLVFHEPYTVAEAMTPLVTASSVLGKT
jgi:hypothetical protein